MRLSVQIKTCRLYQIKSHSILLAVTAMIKIRKAILVVKYIQFKLSVAD